MRIYYRIWVDCITRLRSIEANKNNWQLKSIIAMSFAMTYNFVLLMAILQRHVLGHYFYKLNIPFLSHYENNILTIFILFILPCVILNYLLIFRGKRYEKLLKKYSYHNGKLFAAYFSISLLLPVILLLIGLFLYK
jgi:hypothetical protein